MTSTTDETYYQQRLRQERDRAERSTDPVTRRVHSELAERYAAMVRPEPVA